MTPTSSPRSSVADASRSRKIVASAILANDIPKLSYVKLDVSLIIPWRVVEAATEGIRCASNVVFVATPGLTDNCNARPRIRDSHMKVYR